MHAYDEFSNKRIENRRKVNLLFGCYNYKNEREVVISYRRNRAAERKVVAVHNSNSRPREAVGT